MKQIKKAIAGTIADRSRASIFWYLAMVGVQSLNTGKRWQGVANFADISTVLGIDEKYETLSIYAHTCRIQKRPSLDLFET